ncbi:MAG: hypothetical protein PHW83_13410 [Bacteroidales bacterium]|jgi:hypothetical protein|nr:hypothetical protein [Bacteroidales bacterium]
MEVYDKIIAFYNRIKNDQFHRYKSWEHCYSYFHNCNTKYSNEYAALQLAFYLASWGMYRGSSYLLWKDYKIHIELIEIIYPKYDSLFNMKFDNPDLDKNNIELILKLINIIKKYYLENIKIVDNENKEVIASDTLATKILLGMYGCVPAFDENFDAGLKFEKIYNKSVEINLKSGKVFEYYRNNTSQFIDAQKYIKKYSNILYPEMKLVDMYFWEWGRMYNSLKGYVKN